MWQIVQSPITRDRRSADNELLSFCRNQHAVCLCISFRSLLMVISKYVRATESSTLSTNRKPQNVDRFTFSIISLSLIASSSIMCSLTYPFVTLLSNLSTDSESDSELLWKKRSFAELFLVLQHLRNHLKFCIAVEKLWRVLSNNAKLFKVLSISSEPQKVLPYNSKPHKVFCWTVLNPASSVL